MTDTHSSGSYLLVATTCSDRGILSRIAQHLVEARLAACVQISGPLQSIYRWEEKVESAEEWLLQAKTHASLWEAAAATIKTLHSYQVPELIATPLTHVAPDYERWLDEALRL
jgi:periplasmic divalent cation tolerance protein